MRKNVILIIFCILFQNSCTEKDAIPIKSQVDILNEDSPPSCFDSLGILHNNLLDYHYYKLYPHDSTRIYRLLYTYNNQTYPTKELLDTVFDNFSQICSTWGWPQATINANKTYTLNLLNEAGMIANVNGVYIIKDFVGNMQNLAQAAVNLNYISQSEYNALEQILINFDNENIFIVDSIINSIDLSQYDVDDYPAIYRLKSVYNYSKEFWSVIYNTSSIDFKGNNPQGLGEFVDFLFVAATDAIAGAMAAYNPATVAFTGYISAGASAVMQGWIEIKNSNSCNCPVCAYYYEDKL